MTILRLFFLIALFLSGSAAEPDQDAPNNWPSHSNSTEFIRMHCGATPHPDTCLQSLSGYASGVKLDPARLASAGIILSSSRASALASIYSSNLTHGAGASDPGCLAALRDCVEMFHGAVSYLRMSLRQIRRLSGDEEELKRRLSNVQTWISSALTDEETCTDGIDEVACNEEAKADVRDRAEKVKEVTSIALGLVKSIADKVAP